MAIEFGRELAGNLEVAQSREWLATNGIGGYASGSVAGLQTRRYHGILVAALEPPLGRTLLLAKLDETVHYGGLHYPLYTNRWAGGLVEPAGYLHIESFHLDGSIPVWRFAIGDALLTKQIWMEPGANTTYVSYHLRRASESVALFVKAMVNYRAHHSLTRGGDWQMEIEAIPRGIGVRAFAEAVPYYILSDATDVAVSRDWYLGYELSAEQYRGLDHNEDHLFAATFQFMLAPGERVIIVASCEAEPDLDGRAALARRRNYERNLIGQANLKATTTPGWIKQLILAADQFVVSRSLPDAREGKSIIAGYHWFGDWGRDTMIALPGLTLPTGRPDVAQAVLRTYAEYVDQGMLPNRFPDEGENPEYNTVDATLWYFEALRAYYTATKDIELLKDLFPVLADIVSWHRRGTRYRIKVDPDDGLLYAGEPGVQLTWMDAKVDDWVVTPRIGKPVEVNALWYNALKSMAKFARLIDRPDDEYEKMASRTAKGFGRFWNERARFCFDVIDGPGGPDASLRPNQLLAVSLEESPLSPWQQRAVVEICARHLLTSHGLRSLSRDDTRYRGQYGGDRYQRDSIYHQGAVWGWLLGPFALAHLRLYDDAETALEFLKPMAHHLSAAGLGTLSEIFDGDEPMKARGCIAQAWTVAEILRAWHEIKDRRSNSDFARQSVDKYTC